MISQPDLTERTVTGATPVDPARLPDINLGRLCELSRAAQPPATSAQPRVRVLRDRAAVDELVPAWRALAERTGHDATAYPSWILGCFDTDPHYAGSRLRVVTVHDGDELIGIGPFAEQRRRGLRVVSFIGLWMGQTNRLIVAPDDRATASSIWDALRTPRTFLQLQAVDDALGLATLEEAGRWATRVEARSTCLVVDTSRPLTELIDEPERRSLKKLLGSTQRRLVSDGCTLELRTACGLAGLGGLLPLIGEVEAHAHGDWHAGGPHSELAAGRVPELLRRAADDGLLFADVVLAGERPMAYLIALIGAGRATALLIGHDPETRRYSPGHLAIAGLYDFAHDQGRLPVDLSLGEFEYKTRWSRDPYGITSLVAAPHRAGLELTLSVRSLQGRVRDGVAAGRDRLRRSA